MSIEIINLNYDGFSRYQAIVDYLNPWDIVSLLSIGKELKRLQRVYVSTPLTNEGRVPSDCSVWSREKRSDEWRIEDVPTFASWDLLVSL